MGPRPEGLKRPINRLGGLFTPPGALPLGPPYLATYARVNFCPSLRVRVRIEAAYLRRLCANPLTGTAPGAFDLKADKSLPWTGRRI